MECISDADLDATFGADPDPDTQAEFDAYAGLNQRIGQSCGTKYGADLRLFATEQAARDMDAVRAAVGDEKLTYLGYSYGTLLGATYAQLFPNKIRAFVLDGAVDPGQDFVAGSEGQAKGFERAFGNFATWCTQNAGRCPIAPDAKGAVTAAIDKARVSPVRSGSREATAGWVFYAVISSLYTEQGWEQLAKAIDDLQAGDASGVFELADSYAERDADGQYSNLFDANAAVNCADNAKKPSVAQIRSLQSQWRAKYPLFGAPLAVGMLTCAYWPAERDPYPTGEAKGAPPILVVGTTGDPATPYEQTAKLADMLGVGVVLTWEGEGHTAYPQTSCVTETVDNYFISLEVPRPVGAAHPVELLDHRPDGAQVLLDLLLLLVPERVRVDDQPAREVGGDQRDHQQHHRGDQQAGQDAPLPRRRVRVAVPDRGRRHDRPPHGVADALLLGEAVERTADDDHPEVREYQRARRVGQPHDAAIDLVQRPEQQLHAA
ncbi:hypothetical protein Prum_023670 [Phytohabitans rumicis]|uniref:Peptidase S33 tripeptidyl aminopeptidase-like C-terminal domain-containing protein n=1 Tax=Phytohabitans rumicis TaxID=1076125 RepID=A0A6V8L7T6_9ACTN|nr:hypothetical protein Prum_023670 [Phytohabitans rumicis]